MIRASTLRTSSVLTGLTQAGNALAWRYHRYQDAAFDRRYELDTCQNESSYLLRLSSENTRFAVPYEPVQIFMFRRMLRVLAIDYSDYCFVDLGSGKGRALLLAAQYGFSRVIGIEFSPELQEVARNNVRSFESKTSLKRKIELICMDAVEYELPRKNLVLFLYNPFVGAAMQAVVDRIASFVAGEGCDLWLLYRNPQCSNLFDSVHGLDLSASTGSFRIYRKTQRPRHGQ